MSTSSASYAAIGGPDGYLATLTPFKGNSLRAYEHGPSRWGYAPEWVQETFKAFELEHGRPVYTVYSYATPVALAFPDGFVWVPDVRYSQTTSRGQGSCRAWLNYAHRTELVA